MLLSFSFDKYISPSGMRMLWMVILVLIVVLVLYLRYKYLRYKANPLRIRKKVWYSGGLKMSVNVRNVSRKLIEIDTPVIEFRQPRMSKRKFKIVAPGDKDIFPLGLSPQTSYDFIVKFTPLYEHEPLLRKYKQVIIRIKDKNGKPITSKKVKISLPK